MNTRTRTAAAAAATASNASVNAPQVIISKGTSIDTSDIELDGLDKSIELGAELTLEELRDQLNAGVVDVDNPAFANHVETLAFMEERVLVRVLPSSEPHAERIIEVYNNGVPQFFIRDEWVIARRKFVEVLARAKPFSVTTPESVDARGNKTNRVETHHGQRYPFQMKDSNPRGDGWLNAVMKEQ